MAWGGMIRVVRQSRPIDVCYFVSSVARTTSLLKQSALLTTRYEPHSLGDYAAVTVSLSGVRGNTSLVLRIDRSDVSMQVDINNKTHLLISTYY